MNPKIEKILEILDQAIQPFPKHSSSYQWWCETCGIIQGTAKFEAPTCDCDSSECDHEGKCDQTMERYFPLIHDPSRGRHSST